jgi:hypothetical protein
MKPRILLISVMVFPAIFFGGGGGYFFLLLIFTVLEAVKPAVCGIGRSHQ